MLRAIMWFTLGFVAGKCAMTPEVKSAISKCTEKMTEMAQQGADYIREEFGQSEKDRSEKDRRHEILFRKFSL